MLRLLAAAVLTAAVATPVFAADITGRWRTPGNGGEVEVYPCGGAVCGKLISSAHIAKDPGALDAKNKDPKLASRKLKGLTFLTGFTGGPTEWKGGKVYNPEDGNTYSGTITAVGADTLKLKGCVVAPLCKTQTWTRIK
ncbi:DUF2147 domain-containing protein [Caulobacter mirabilis]|uniref:DUF2147 domain-containing protein n=1 Tax=Caulobacter mirabilis TaxID=69666 RepID=A0A2D2B0I9_9CAUL|nr:DUF2147 domain-containing protein [Caulobacter mirabilis]ATQ43780.1 hypothetical protein CSW64_15950 [Caulobacter mirabilis]